MSAEREVKLEAPPGFRLPAIGDGSAGDPPDVLAGPGTTERTLTTYLDTEDLRIARWGSSLRYRAGEGWTVKLPAAREGSALVREEHRFPGGPTRPPDAATSGRAAVHVSSLTHAASSITSSAGA